MPGVLKDITGQVFGRWTVLHYSHKEERASYDRHMWACRCDCGTERLVLHSSLTKGVSASCGCYNREVTRGRVAPHRKPPGESCLNHLYLVYRRGAKERGYAFNLSKENFRFLTSQPCHYCGVPPKQLTGRTKYKANGDYTYNGLDRVTNTEGYSLENCAPCCKICNYVKRTFTEEEFRQWLAQLVGHHVEKGYAHARQV